MSAPKTCFQPQDFYEEVPDPGFYPACIESARFRRSARDNRMLQLAYALEEVGPAYRMVCDYFVVEGERVSASGILLARRRLVELYRACRIFPNEGDEIAPAQLVGARLEVRVEHQRWEGRLQLRVIGYRPLESFSPDERIHF